MMKRNLLIPLFLGLLGLALTRGVAVTPGVGDTDTDGDEAEFAGPPVPHAKSVRPRPSMRSVRFRDAMATSGLGA
jgi:hypothetical protein